MAGIIGDLSTAELRRQLRTDGLIIDSGAVSTRVFSTARETATAIHQSYSNYPLIDAGTLANYRLRIALTGGWRRLFHRQVSGQVGVAAPITPFPAIMAPLMLEMTLNWCVATRSNRYLMFHSAVLEKNGRAIILPGDSGQGKSTLCAALASSGWRLFSDEFGLLDLETGLMVPNVRPVSLKNASIGIMEKRLGKGILTPSIYDTPKGEVAYLPASPEAIDRRKEQAQPVAVIFPFYNAEAMDEAVAYPKARALITLCGGAANYEMLGERAFRVMSDFVDRYPVCRIAYSKLDGAIEMVEEIAEQAQAGAQELKLGAEA